MTAHLHTKVVNVSDGVTYLATWTYARGIISSVPGGAQDQTSTANKTVVYRLGNGPAAASYRGSSRGPQRVNRVAG